ncbi:hypothetical protein [uncultured Clostridium sp.]|uniref:hypothetical protein n=1 Tax=uncultured Clostridium sp. TaxID=59620 RepID=UPI0025D95FC4|nr:hypothetical protein [uncultured Clostridium sp.]
MAYNVIDIIEKTVKIEEKRILMINELIDENMNLPTINLLGKVFEKESRKIIKYCKQIQSEISNIELEEIDFRTYDKISFLIYEFCNKMYMPAVKTPKEYLHNTLRMAGDELALFIDIQGRLVNNSNNANGITYDVLSRIISNLKNHVESISKVV